MVQCAQIVLSQVSDDLLPLFPAPFEKFLTISQFWRAQRGEGGPTALSYIGTEVAADIFCSQRDPFGSKIRCLFLGTNTLFGLTCKDPAKLSSSLQASKPAD